MQFRLIPVGGLWRTLTTHVYGSACPRSLKTAGALILLSASGASLASAQQITGKITDPTGAIIPKATVTVHNQSTGVDVDAKPSDGGVYTVPYLKPGTYTLRVMANGFKGFEQTNITLELDQIATINVGLQIGTAQETITVSSSQVLLDTQHVSAGDVMTSERLTSLPINSENALNAAYLSAGTVNQNGPTTVRIDQQVSGGLIANNQGVDFAIDGMSVPAYGFQSMSYTPPLEAVQEFKLVTSNYDASFGYSQGGQLNLSLKNGTNKLHGVVYGNYQRGWLNANTWRNANLGIHRATSTYNQYGFELDGPVVIPHLYDGHNKSFLMMSYDYNSSPSQSTIIQSVPPTAWLGCVTGAGNGACDFSGLTTFYSNKYAPTTIYDPNSGVLVTETDGKQYVKRTPIPGNKITPAMVNPVARAILQYYVAPNTTPSSGNFWQNNRTDVAANTRKYRNVLSRWDYNFDPNNRFFISFGYWDNFATAASGLPRSNPAVNAVHFTNGMKNQTYSIDYIHVFTPTWVSEFKANVGVTNLTDYPGPKAFDPTTLGFSGSTIGLSPSMERFPQMTLSGFSQLGSLSGLNRTSNDLVLQPSTTWTKGTHTIRGGADLRFWQQGTISAASGGMGLSIGTAWTSNPDGVDVARTFGNSSYPTGNSIASFLLGTGDSGSVYAPVTMFLSASEWSYWAQDDWKALPRLTFNLGLRYDYFNPGHDRYKQFNYGFDFTTPNSAINSQMAALGQSIPGGAKILGGMGYEGVNGNPNGPFASNYKEWFEPRLGMNYQINSKTVFHAGLARTVSGFDITHTPSQLGFTSTTAYVGSNDNNVTPLHNLATPFTQLTPAPGPSLGLNAGVGTAITYYRTDGKAPWYWNFTATVERQLTAHDTITFGFVGTRMMNAETSIDINHMSPSYAASCDYARGGNRHSCDDTVNLAANPFKGVPAFIGSSYYTSATINKSAFTRPFPQFQAINAYYTNIAKNSYNALQVTGVHRMQGGLILNGTYTYSKIIDFGAWTDYMNGIPQRVVDGGDRPHRITLSGTYQLPIGKGKMLLSNSNRWLDLAIGGWETSGAFLLQSGVPWNPTGTGAGAGVELLGIGSQARTGRHVVTSADGTGTPVGSIRAAVPCVGYYNDAAAGAFTLEPQSVNYGCSSTPWVARPSYGVIHNIEYTGIRDGRVVNLDANITKKVTLREGYVLQVRMDAFNALNHPLFTQDYDTNAGSPYFGTIVRGGTAGVDMSNAPRTLQLSGKFIF